MPCPLETVIWFRMLCEHPHFGDVPLYGTKKSGCSVGFAFASLELESELCTWLSYWLMDKSLLLAHL